MQDYEMITHFSSPSRFKESYWAAKRTGELAAPDARKSTRAGRGVRIYTSVYSILQYLPQVGSRVRAEYPTATEMEQGAQTIA